MRWRRCGKAKPTSQSVFPTSDRLQPDPPDRRRAVLKTTPAKEMKMQNEGRKIMHLPELKVSRTCVRVPVAPHHFRQLPLRCFGHRVEQARRSSPRPWLQAGGRPEKQASTPCRWTPPIRTLWSRFVSVLRPDGRQRPGCLRCCGDQSARAPPTPSRSVSRWHE